MADRIGTNNPDTLTGTTGDDFFDAFGGNDSLIGLAGDDGMFGGDGNDTINGGDDNDYIRGDAGNDSLIGGAGDSDTVAYDNSTSGVTVNLATGTASDGMGGTDTLSGFERIRGSMHNDSLTGDGYERNVIAGLAGNDTINGGAGTRDDVDYSRDANYGGLLGVFVDLAAGFATDGFGNTDTLSNIERMRGTDFNDTLLGDDNDNNFQPFAGNDTIDGRGGYDVVDYDVDNPTTGIVVNFTSATTATVKGGPGGTDTLSNIEEIHGTRLADRMIGHDGYNKFWGDDGNDYQEGRNGNDQLRGDAGRDTLLGGSGDDNFQGGSGNDLIDGGTGWDQVDYWWDGPSTGIVVTFTGVGAATVSDGLGGTDTLRGIEEVVGTDFADSIVGGAGDQQFRGGLGNDTLRGGAGRDHLEGGDGDDLLDASGGSAASNGWGDYIRPGLGNNTILGNQALWNSGEGADISYGDLSGIGGVILTVLDGLGTGTVTSGNAGQVNDTFTFIHYFEGSLDGDSMTGSNADRWEGWAGLEGDDTINGGGGWDTLNYNYESSYGSNPSAGITVDLGGGTIIDTWGNTDVVSGIDEVRGTANDDFFDARGLTNGITFEGEGGNDTMFGGAGNDKFYTAGVGDDSMNGGDGDDDMAGGQGNDALIGGNGDDYMQAGSGTDNVDGGADWDTLTYLHDNDATGGVVFTFTGGGSGTVLDWGGNTDTFSNIEQGRGTNFGDTFNGSADADNFQGEGGNDTMNGGDGDDYFQGGRGSDSIVGGNGMDWVGYNWDQPKKAIVVTFAASGNATVKDGLGGTDKLFSIEGIDGTRFGDTFTGNAGQQIFNGMRGNDTMDGGGATNDWASYSNTSNSGGSQGININLRTGVGIDTFGNRDTLRNIENIWGSEWGDRVIANNGVTHQLNGNDGNDSLAGANRNDTIFGGNGDDILVGLAGGDELHGEDGNDTLMGGTGNDTLEGGTGNDTFVFNSGPGATNVDDIIDFVVGEDVIALENAVFAAVGAAGSLAAGAFNTGTSATEADDRLIFDTATGDLFYDSDGSGAAAAVRIATISGLTGTLSASDFTII